MTFISSHLLLGNMSDIFEFHSQHLLPAFQAAYPNAKRISKVFLDFLDDFDIYSIYCQNSKKSEELRQHLGSVDNAFLTKCQKQLNHALPISAFLLKPIQRITKYQLLLDQMLKYTLKQETQNPEVSEIIKRALDGMLRCVRTVNDSLQNITGYQVGYDTNQSYGFCMKYGTYLLIRSLKLIKLKKRRNSK